MRFILFGVLVLSLMTPCVVAETPQERVGSRDGWFVMNYTTSLPETRYRSPSVVIGEWSFWSLELDPMIGLRMRPVNYTTIEVNVFNNPTRASFASVVATVCVNGTTMVTPKGVVTPVLSSSWCGADHIYRINVFPTGTNFKLQFVEHPSFEIWLGEGQGGGGDGLGTCESMEATLINTTSTNGSIVLTTTVNGSYYYVGGVTGCTPQTLYFEYWNTTLTAWRQIPQNNNSEPVDCNGQRCFNSTPTTPTSFRTFQQKIRCDWTGQVNVSTRLRYTKLSSPYDVQSPPVLLYCGIQPPSPPPPSINVTSIQTPPVPRRKEYGWIVLLGGIALVTLVTLPYRKEKLYPEPPQ